MAGHTRLGAWVVGLARAALAVAVGLVGTGRFAAADEAARRAPDRGGPSATWTSVGVAFTVDRGQFDQDGAITLGGNVAPVGPVHLFLNGDPVGVYRTGGVLLPLDVWLRPGENRVELRGQSAEPVYVKVVRRLGREKFEQLGKTVIRKGEDRSPEAAFDPGPRPALPALDELPTGPEGEAECRRRALGLLDRLRGHAARHAAGAFERDLFAGAAMWVPALTSKPLDAATAGARVRKLIADEGAKPVAERSAPVAVVGRRAVLVYVPQGADPEPKEAFRPPYALRVRRAGEELTVGPLACVRVKGEWIVWQAEATLAGAGADAPRPKAPPAPAREQLPELPGPPTAPSKGTGPG